MATVAVGVVISEYSVSRICREFIRAIEAWIFVVVVVRQVAKGGDGCRPAMWCLRRMGCAELQKQKWLGVVGVGAGARR